MGFKGSDVLDDIVYMDNDQFFSFEISIKQDSIKSVLHSFLENNKLYLKMKDTDSLLTLKS